MEYLIEIVSCIQLQDNIILFPILTASHQYFFGVKQVAITHISRKFHIFRRVIPKELLNRSIWVGFNSILISERETLPLINIYEPLAPFFFRELFIFVIASFRIKQLVSQNVQPISVTPENVNYNEIDSTLMNVERQHGVEYFFA